MGVIPRTELSDPLVKLAEYQEGVISRTQALGGGLTDQVIKRLVNQGSWSRIAPGVYSVRSGTTSWHARAWAGVLIGGGDAMLADQAAGYVWGLVDDAPGRITVLVRHEQHLRQRWPWYFRRTREMPRPVGALPRTPLPATVVDLCIAEPAQQARLLADAVAGRRTSPGAVLKVLDARERVPGRRGIEAQLGRVREGIHSELEHVYARDVERAHGLPRGRRQVFDGQYRTDVRYDGLIVELDGRAGHQGSGAFRDMNRDNAHLLAGELTLRYGWDDCWQRPCGVAVQVAEMLCRLGWDGTMSLCARCKTHWG